MKKAEIVKSVNGLFSKTSFQLKKHSPEILVVAGVIGVVTSAVMACKATTKVNEILDKTKEDVEAIHKCEEDESMKEQYSSEDAKKDLTIVYAQTGVKFAKLYGPSVVLAEVLTSSFSAFACSLTLDLSSLASSRSFAIFSFRSATRFALSSLDNPDGISIAIKRSISVFFFSSIRSFWSSASSPISSNSNGVRPDSLPNQQRRRHCPFRRDK